MSTQEGPEVLSAGGQRTGSATVRQRRKAVGALAMMSLLLASGGGQAMADSRVSEARPAFAGQAKYGTQTKCFRLHAGGPTHRALPDPECAGALRWIVPLEYDGGGRMKIRVTAVGAESGTRNVECQAFTGKSGGSEIPGSIARTELNNGQTEYLVTYVDAVRWGGTWVDCKMEPGTRLFHVSSVFE